MSGLKKYIKQAGELVSQMTVLEKATLVSGFGMWETQGCERLGIKKVDMSDGPHGVRKQLDYYDIAVDESVKTVCFPSGSCVSSSWDPDLLFEMGKALGNNAKLHDISMLLGPGTNIKRSPLCGRNFEYFSEDPHLAGELAAAYIEGVQSTGVSATVKHFAANNQETRRLTVNAVIDERALREIYLPAFEKAVRSADVDAVMSAYNTLNGDSCSQNRRLLIDILREEWQFDGMVVSDWGAVTDDIAAIQADNDLKMPGFKDGPIRVEQAVADGRLSEARLDDAARHVIAFLLKANDIKQTDESWGKGVEDFDGNHALARRVAGESIVLLENNGVLPLKKQNKLLVVGEYARAPHFQGGGSSHVNAYKVDSSLELFEQGGWNVKYIEGFEDTDAILKAAKTCDVALLFAGTSETEESEGFDRENLDLPDSQNRVVHALCGAKIPTVAVLFEGSAVAMPWANEIDGVLAAFLPGESAGGAVFDVLTGAVNPSGKLAETFPVRLCDTPSYLTFPGEEDYSFYGEGLFVGYRYYEKKQIIPTFCFGHGLSYTAFIYSDLRVNRTNFLDNEDICVDIDITAAGHMAGKETVQIYIEPDRQTSAKGVIRPVKELKSFKKVSLQPGETKTLHFNLSHRDFAYYDVVNKCWRVRSGKYKILAGTSSCDIRSKLEIDIVSTFVEKKLITRDTLMGDMAATEKGKGILIGLLASLDTKMRDKTGDKPGDDEAYMKMIMSMPIKTLILVGVSTEQVDEIISELNEE